MRTRVYSSCTIDGSVGNNSKLKCGTEKFIGLKNIEKKETEEEENRRLDAYAATLGQDSDSE